MPRLRRFEDYRFVGLRDSMVVFDCDDAKQFEQLSAEAADLMATNRLSTFAPDTLAEARNRGFRPAG